MSATRTRPRIVFMGTPTFAVAALEACADLGQLVAVVTQPDKPKGRGQAQTASPVKQAALARGVPVLQPVKIRHTGFAEELAALEPDVCVVAAYGKILPKEVLAVPAQGCVNVHASLLPRHRGAAPIQWAIAEGDERSGICLMQMDEGLDTGPVISRHELLLAPDETGASLLDRLAELGGVALREDLPRYLRGELVPVPQSAEGATYAPMLKKEDGELHFDRPAPVLERRIRAFTPWPGAFTRFDGQLLKVHKAALGAATGLPGELLRADPAGIEVACAEGSLVLQELQPEGKRRMTAAEFLAGRRLHRGQRPFTQ